MQHTRLIRAANDIDNDSGVDEDIDPKEIRSMKKSGGRALGFMPDNGEGDIKFWRIDNSQTVPADPNGILLGSKAYVLKYHYKKGGEEGYVIYFWQVSIDSPTQYVIGKEMLNFIIRKGLSKIKNCNTHTQTG